jgi:drug/metabolite transporter (DMT)-like permease
VILTSQFVPEGSPMTRSSTLTGLVIATLAALAFGMSGPFAKPLLEAGWSPAAAVTARAIIGGLVLAPFAIIALKGRWMALWRARSRILAIGLIGVAATQLAYFAAIERISVGTAILIEFMAPLLLVMFVWARSRKAPKAVVLVGSVFALFGLTLVVSPGGDVTLDPIGLAFAAAAAVGCAVYFVAAARVDDDLPPVAVASVSLILGGIMIGLIGLTGVMPLRATFDTVQLFGGSVAWWIPMLIVGVIATGIAYATSIKGSQILGSRLASFAGLLEVVAATVYAWLLLGEQMTVPQLIGGVLILVGIAFVRSDRTVEVVPPAESASLQRAA